MEVGEVALGSVGWAGEMRWNYRSQRFLQGMPGPKRISSCSQVQSLAANSPTQILLGWEPGYVPDAQIGVPGKEGRDV